MSNAKLLAITILGLSIGWIVFQAAPALQPALIAIVAAYLLNPLVELIEKKLKIKKHLAIAVLLTLIVVGFVILGNLIVTPIMNQATEFIQEFQSIRGNINQVIENIFAYLEKLGISQTMIGELKQFATQAFNGLGNFMVSAITSTLGFILKIVDLALIVILSIYFLASGKQMVQYLVEHTPKSLHQTVLNLIEGTDHVIWNYIKTQALIALIVGAASTVAFMLIGIKFSVLLGVIAGILNFIPYFGSIFAGALATLIALLTDGFNQALITLIAVLVIQQIESTFITPSLQGKSADMHPAVIMMAIVVGDYFWGTLGMFIAVPMFGLARLIVTEAAKMIKQIE